MDDDDENVIANEVIATVHPLKQETTVMLFPSAITAVERLPNLLTLHPAIAKSFFYMLSANILYLGRRANIRNVSMGTMLRYRTQRESGVTIPMYIIFLLAWQSLLHWLHRGEDHPKCPPQTPQWHRDRSG